MRLQREPAWRVEKNPTTGEPIGWIYPVLVKPHPFLDSSVRGALREVAEQAKKISAHYRFFAYSHSTIATTPAFNGPPSSGWAAGTIAAQCSSFVWAAVQRANEELESQGEPTIQLEGSGEDTDLRRPTDFDGIYHYSEDERYDAAKALYKTTYSRVANTVQQKVDDFPWIVGAIADVVPGVSPIIEDFKAGLASVVANQLCNTFASDNAADLGDSWTTPGHGMAVSPDDTMLRWDVRDAPDTFPTPPPAGRINVYGTSTPVAISEGGWVSEPILKIKDSVGFFYAAGFVVRRDNPGDSLHREPGATVRYGCRVTTTNAEGTFSFAKVKAGAYVLQATKFVINKDSGVAIEWKSKPLVEEIRDGEAYIGLELELLPPEGMARDIKVQTHHDIVDRVVIGKDRWGHFNLDRTLGLRWDPRDDSSAVPQSDQRNTVLTDHTSMVTPEVGSGVHVSVAVTATLQQVGGPGQLPYDGSVMVDTTLTFFDTDEGETNDVVIDAGRVLKPGEIFTLPYNLKSDDTVPERASGYVQISNILAVLP